MAGLAVRSVALQSDTTQAWKEAGVQFARRGRTQEAIIRMAVENGYEFILNLGKSQFQPVIHPWAPPNPGFFWNKGQNILPLLYPGATRRLLDELMPAQPDQFPADVWIKAPGMKGKGKYKKAVTHPLILPDEWDWQVHMEGTEYRVLTVGGRVVQSFIKTGGAVEREYEWVGLTDTPRPIKRLARRAAGLLNGRNVVGWDIVQPDLDELTGAQPKILEGNSCPGVNYATADRIVTEIRRQKGELNAEHDNGNV